MVLWISLKSRPRFATCVFCTGAVPVLVLPGFPADARRVPASGAQPQQLLPGVLLLGRR